MCSPASLARYLYSDLDDSDLLRTEQAYVWRSGSVNLLIYLPAIRAWSKPSIWRQTTEFLHVGNTRTGIFYFAATMVGES